MTNNLVLQHVVFPFEFDITAYPLYFDVEKSGSCEFLSKYSCKLKANSVLSLACYENAFPASYWSFNTNVTKVAFRAVFDKEVTLRLFASSPDGLPSLQAELKSSSFCVPKFITGFEDGGWLWVEIESGKSSCILKEATWILLETAQSQDCYVENIGNYDISNLGKATVAITTMNKPDFVINNLNKFAKSFENDFMQVIDKVLVTDQGNNLVEKHPDFSAVSEKLKSRLQVIKQANLGGSGGFSRGMFEASYNLNSDYVILLDDDTMLETETFYRLVCFAHFCKDPKIVGAHMFWTNQKATLQSWAEFMDTKDMSWKKIDGLPSPYNFALQSFTKTPWIHRRREAGYNGWWCCLIPTEVVKKIGLSLPIFIKWDDSEYALRANKVLGTQTVSLPGAFVWHENWTIKEDAIDWQSFYHERNRLVVALLHANEYYPIKNIFAMLFRVLKSSLTMRYSTVCLAIEAIDNVLAGPETVISDLPSRLPAINQIRAGFSDSKKIPLIDAPKPFEQFDLPAVFGIKNKVKTIIKSAIHQLKPTQKDFSDIKSLPENDNFVQYYFGHEENVSWKIMQSDSAVFSSIDGKNGFVYRRDQKMFLSQTFALSKKLLKLLISWPKLSKQYRNAWKTMVSPTTWEKLFYQK